MLTQAPLFPFLPATREEVHARGWEAVDIILVTGDAYVDHPSFGIALIGRLLEAHGYRVAILAQPRYGNADEFKIFGRPRLFFGITAGNLDSIVANYTGNAKVRDVDDYSPGGNPYFADKAARNLRRRPDRATILYANLARCAYKEVPVILGGLEASLRRFVHYDYQQQKLRSSVLADAKADLLVYGMGERAVVEIARRLDRGNGLEGIAGTCERLTERERHSRNYSSVPLELPSFSELRDDPGRFLEAELLVDGQARAFSSQPVLQEQNSCWVLQHRPAEPLSGEELDQLYGLPFRREPHPTAGEVPAARMIRNSLTIVRGCCGNCSFCAISRHQGPLVTSRSVESIVSEAGELARSPGFDGTITDLGGPTANLFGATCPHSASCRKHDCLYPKVCKHLKLDENIFIRLLDETKKLAGVRHVFISSGLRMELLLRTRKLLEKILVDHTPGAMKIAPEHTENELLKLMHKPAVSVLQEFVKMCGSIGARLGRQIRLTPYIISAHPGCSYVDMRKMSEKMGSLGLTVRQLQDFTPTPGTISTAMYVSGLDCLQKKPLYVARGASERRKQRQVLDNFMDPGGPKKGGRVRTARGKTTLK
jgi:uncharacterized radical SAM protein YgiQ